VLERERRSGSGSTTRRASGSARSQKQGREESASARDAVHRQHDELRALLASDAPDAGAVMAKADAIGAAETALQKQRLRTMLAVRALLTSEQRRELVKIHEEFRARRGRRGDSTERPAGAIAASASNVAAGGPHVRQSRAPGCSASRSRSCRRRWAGSRGAQLASAVSNAGALGIIETSSGELDAMRDEIRKMRELTDSRSASTSRRLFVRDPSIVDFVVEQGVRS
jgi:hypothetical protein